MSERPERVGDEALKQKISDLLRQYRHGSALLVIADASVSHEQMDVIGDAERITDLFLAARAVLEAIRRYAIGNPPPPHILGELLARVETAELVLSLRQPMAVAQMRAPNAPKPTVN